MKILKLLPLFFLCILSFSCADPKAVYFDVPTLMAMTQKQIISTLGDPKTTTKTDSYATNLPGGPITIPQETLLETYKSGRYVLRLSYILSKCDRPVEALIYDEEIEMMGTLDTVLLKNACNLNNDSLLPAGFFKERLPIGYKIKNFGCK